ncbi:hypothetical protein HGRIS_008585 [Hohenbuehelia grisea]|uniref:NFX1-type zinc finger-containing protein 1 n=1 Tax=Hohenbuehelia grisea TaxID=104357 RepID=A0ABR3J8V6_9AGAR
MYRAKRPCNFFNSPGGCRLGDACAFSHAPGSPNLASRSPSKQIISGTPSRSNANSGPASPSAPPGTCRVYWASGSCRNEFNCRFRHVQASESTSPGSPLAPGPRTNSRTQAGAMDPIAPFLTETALARMSGAGSDIFSAPPSEPMTPIAAHNTLKWFLDNDYRFRTSFDVCAFLKPINSATSVNESWTTEEGQLLLTSLAKGNGILRIRDIIQWTPVSASSNNAATLSFQRGLLPLLKFLSSDFVVKSTLSHMVNALYMCIMDNFPRFAQTLRTCMNASIAARSFRDPNSAPIKHVNPPLGSEVIASIAGILFECLTRFKNSVPVNPDLAPLVRNFQGWTDTWMDGIFKGSSEGAFDDMLNQPANVAARDQITSHLRGKVERLVAIVDREENKLHSPTRTAGIRVPSVFRDEAVLAALHTTYEGPGTLRLLGIRHDNDFIDISSIRIAPTQAELVTPFKPFLPANIYAAPHPFKADSMARLLDIQFRLYREELMAPLRTSVQLVREDLQAPPQAETRLSQLLSNGGGKYHADPSPSGDIDFNVYTNVKFTSLTNNRHGVTAGLAFDAPPGRARASQASARVRFWESMGGKRLMQGGLVALVWKDAAVSDADGIEIHLGTLTSSLKNLTESSRRSPDKVGVCISFFDAELELRILEALKDSTAHISDVKILVEAPVLFESIRPFLEALQGEPESVPFAKYLTLRPPGYFNGITLDAPQYARTPGFRFNLSSLFPPEAEVAGLTLDVSRPASITAARHELRKSRLDPSQADAVVDALTSEVALIQGPPGTGKSFTGVELLRVLLANKIKPILMIALTNHALDHMLCSVLDANITHKVVRLGSRSADERISQFSIENMEMAAGRSRLDRTLSRNHRVIREKEEELRSLFKRFLDARVSSSNISHLIALGFPEHNENLMQPSPWISAIMTHKYLALGEGWRRTGKQYEEEEEDTSVYAFWRHAGDLLFLQNPTASPDVLEPTPSLNNAHSESNPPNKISVLRDDDRGNDRTDNDVDPSYEEPDLQAEAMWQSQVTQPENKISESATTSPKSCPRPIETEPLDQDLGIHLSDISNPSVFFANFGSEIPEIPSSNRTLKELLMAPDVWTMSQEERSCLHEFWSEQVRLGINKTHMDEFKALRRQHAQALQEFQEGKEEARRQLLQKVDIIGCTSTGAAKLTSLLKGLDPQVMLVEEAGQVFEAHVLGSLVPSIQHLILIGDPLQLRPILNNYSLSMDSRQGSQIYKFDMSLMERLSASGLHMSQLDVQRRMRPSISLLIRSTLYPKLEDHELVQRYPPVRGFSKDVFFLTHENRENTQGDEFTSKCNTYEVEMIRDMVLYLLRQGCYSQEGDIAVLCAYLGQLRCVRDALSSEVTIVIDERDQQELAYQEEGSERVEFEPDPLQHSSPAIERIKISHQVRLRTIDNYQGEEAKIVILSLVRNAGSITDDETRLGSGRPSIGFLKSDNRVNVALSRAKEGLYILGNASLLSERSRMWKSVIDQLEEANALGTALPVACARHPEKKNLVSEPGQLPSLAPDGGCLYPCDFLLRCDHVCPYKCHPDDPNHIGVVCQENCRRLCARNHQCDKKCSDHCGDCMFPVRDIELPCGHVAPSVPCSRLEALSEVFCTAEVTKELPNCEHDAPVACSTDVAQYLCKKSCNGVLPCCSRNCQSSCSDCQAKNPHLEGGPAALNRVNHIQHPCERALHCAHRCEELCSPEHTCATACKQECRQECAHTRCRHYCSTPCAPCQENCTWTCSHFTCPVPCGSVCARLPCDKRCENTLECGHRCPSVCGEECAIQTCSICAPAQLKEQIVDFINQRRLSDVDSSSETLDELTITLPKCRHVFTVETLDGHCGLNNFYTRRGDDGTWLSLATPDITGQKGPPVCPSCDAAVTASRYGRVFKRAGLDILERNVFGRMSQLLQNVHRQATAGVSMENMKAALNAAVPALTAPSVPSPLGLNEHRKQVLIGQRELPISVQFIIPRDQIHGVAREVSSHWDRATRTLVVAYDQALKVAKIRSAHTSAWQSAYSYIYAQEMELVNSRPDLTSERPEDYAMKMARAKVGQPQPRADRRFLVEAFWVTIKIRLVLIELAQGWLEALCRRPEQFPKLEQKKWAMFISFLLAACTTDTDITLKIAAESESRRQMTTTQLFSLRVALEGFRFSVAMARHFGTYADKREQLVETAQIKLVEAREAVVSTVTEHQMCLPMDAKAAQQGEPHWLHTNFMSIAKVILSEWEELAKSLRADTFYEPVSLNEMMGVVQALDFGITGHWYNCPNGHTFVITECGGAMERSRCPECGATIGGANHRLDDSNTRATEYEELSRNHGARVSNPWV